MGKFSFKTHHWLGFLFFIVLLSRLYFAFQTPEFFGAESYYTLRQIQSIEETGKLIYEDPLSFGGRFLPILPLFYYIAAPFVIIFSGTMVTKLFVNVLATSSIIIIYFMALQLTKRKRLALFTAFIGGFIPLFYGDTVNTFTPQILFIPLLLLFFALFMTLPSKKYVKLIIGVYFAMLLTSAATILVVAGLLVYLLLLYLERVEYTREEIEVILFTTFSTLWFYFIFYGEVLLTHGPQVIWQNLPRALIEQTYSTLNLTDLVINIGVLPFIFGLYIIYRFIFRQKNRSLYLLISFCILLVLLLWLQLLNFSLGIMILSIFLTLFFGQAFLLFVQYIEKTKFSKLIPHLIIVLVVVFIANSIVPSFNRAQLSIDQVITPAERSAFEWMDAALPEDALVISSYNDGHYIAYYGNRATVMDSHFLLIPSVDNRYEDIQRLYQSLSLTEAINIINQYDGTHILLNEQAQQEFAIEKLKYVDQSCFEELYNQDVFIYASLCEVT